MSLDNQNNKATRRRQFFKTAGNYIAGYSLLALVMLALFFLLFRIRSDVILLAFQSGKNQVDVRGISNIIIVFAGLIMMVGVVYAEDYLRKGIPERRLWQCILRIYIATAGAWVFWLALFYILLWIIM
jgi:hypothetical protein